MRNSRALQLAALLALAFRPGPAHAQEQQFDPNTSVKFNLPPDSPVSLLTWDVSQSRASMRGGALTLDINMDVLLRNSASRRVRGITMLIVSQESLPVGRASVSRLIDVGPGETFPLHVDVRLLRPATATGPLIQVNLDGVLFDDLNFYGPNRLESKRTLTFWEMEARRDRQYFQQVLAARGVTGLQQEMLAAIARQEHVERLDVRLNRGRTTTASSEPGHMAQFAFLAVPDAPVKAIEGWAEVSGSEIRSPRVEVENLSGRPVRYVELAWLVTDHSGRQYLAGSVPGSGSDFYLPSGHRGKLLEDTALRLSRADSSAPLEIDKMIGVVSQVEFSSGKMWIPTRESLLAANALNALPPSPEEQRLIDFYRKHGAHALAQELYKK
jgi:hypothetical protein